MEVLAPHSFCQPEMPFLTARPLSVSPETTVIVLPEDATAAGAEVVAFLVVDFLVVVAFFDVVAGAEDRVVEREVDGAADCGAAATAAPALAPPLARAGQRVGCRPATRRDPGRPGPAERQRSASRARRSAASRCRRTPATSTW